MDISKISFNFIELFDLSYTTAQAVFGTDPAAAPPKMQKKIRKWVQKTYIGQEAYPPGVAKFIGGDISDADFIRFLKACHNHVQENGTHKKQLFEIFSSELPEDAKHALWALLEHDPYCGSIRKVGADAQIDIEYGAGYDRTLTLHNASCIPEGDFDCLSFENGSLVKPGNEYRLVGEAQNYDTDICTPFAIHFTDAKVDIRLYRSDEQTFSGTPWMHLQSIASTILNKYFLPGDYLNAREKELLPLLAEISKLSYWAQIPEEFLGGGFPLLKSYTRKHRFPELLLMLEKLEQQYSNNKKKDHIIQKLAAKLNQQKYEPLWRNLYALLVESQAEYPAKASACCSEETLLRIRSDIQWLMESHGYSGTYPDFVKTGAIPGIRLAESYDMSYFVGLEKHVNYRIHCTEDWFNGHLMIDFLCGTQLLRKGEDAGDIYSCLFNAKGRRFFQTVSWEHEYAAPDGETKSDNLEQCVQIAVKKTELRKLTKEEQTALMGFDLPGWQLFFLIFMVTGGLFGIFMTLGFMLIGVVICLLFGQPQVIPDLFAEIPWWGCLAFCWVAFGGSMGIITVLAKRK